eukprot:m.175620 g.175620  ORF g.175620 m.175620 type:complete len:395 (+) comp14616_c0_seq8:123-1307(+)
MEGVFPLEADPPLLQSTNTAPITHPQVGQEQPSDTLRQQQQAPPEVPLPSASADPQPESRAVVQKDQGGNISSPSDIVSHVEAPTGSQPHALDIVQQQQPQQQHPDTSTSVYGSIPSSSDSTTAAVSTSASATDTPRTQVQLMPLMQRMMMPMMVQVPSWTDLTQLANTPQMFKDQLTKLASVYPDLTFRDAAKVFHNHSTGKALTADLGVGSPSVAAPSGTEGASTSSVLMSAPSMHPYVSPACITSDDKISAVRPLILCDKCKRLSREPARVTMTRPHEKLSFRDVTQAMRDEQGNCCMICAGPYDAEEANKVDQERCETTLSHQTERKSCERNFIQSSTQPSIRYSVVTAAGVFTGPIDWNDCRHMASLHTNSCQRFFVTSATARLHVVRA